MITFDPYKAAYNNAEQQWKRVVLAIMKKQGITQIDISDVELMSEDALTLIEDKAGFMRIKGTFQMDESK